MGRTVAGKQAAVAMQHFYRALFILSAVLGSWLGMQAVHELGHVLGAALSGGTIGRVVLHPLSISRTDLAANPHPLVVAWAGPLAGVLLPLLLWGTAARFRLSGAFLLRFFAGFCLIGNGVYLGAGSFARIGDAGELLRHGSSVWLLWVFGLLAVSAGLGLWHGQGRHFGLGPAAEPISPGIACAALTAFVVLVVVGLLVGGP